MTELETVLRLADELQPEQLLHYLGVWLANRKDQKNRAAYAEKFYGTK